MERVELGVKKYLSEKRKEIGNLLKDNNLYIIAKPGIGKTFQSDIWAAEHKTCLIEPMISTRDGATSNLKNFKMLETKDVQSNMDINSSVVVIWDTFMLMLEKNLIRNFDLIVLDESHELISQSNFREKAYSMVEFFSKTNTRFIMMTGTPMGEISLFPNLKTVKINSPEQRALEFNTIKCDGRLLVEDAILAVAKVSCLRKAKTIYYSNSNRAMQDRIVSKLISEHKIGFYSSSMSDKDLEESINKKETFGDYDLVCATSYLSVGVNIKVNDDEEAAIIVTDEKDMTPMSLMQIANRFRDTDLKIFYIHNTKLDSKVKDKTLNELAREELKSNDGVNLNWLSPYLQNEAKKFTKKTALVEVKTNEYSIDGQRQQIQDIYEAVNKLTSIEVFEEYFKKMNYVINEDDYIKNKVKALRKKYDVVQFIANNIREVLDALSTISLEKKIYTKDVLLEDRTGRTRIEDGVIKTQNLNLFNSTIKKIKKLNKEGVLLTNIVSILKSPDSYGKLDSWYRGIDILSRWSEEFEEPLTHIKESTAQSLVQTRVIQETEYLKDRFPKTIAALVAAEKNKLHNVYLLAQKLEVSPQDLVDMFNNMKDPNRLIYSEEIDMYNDLNDMISKKVHKHKEDVSNIRKEANNKGNLKRRQKCSLYKNGELVKEFECKNDVYKYLGVNKLKFKNNEANIDGIKYSITNK